MRIKYLVNDKYEKAKPFNEYIQTHFPQLLTEENPELYIVAGGDGSMLHAIQDTIEDGIPYLGKAMGTFNFLMNEFEDDEKIIRGLLDDKIKIDIFKTSAIGVYLDSKKIGEAVNDVILGEGVMDLFNFSISTASGYFDEFEFKASGLCVSTPIGSTAFNYNNNGRILPLTSELLSITGIVSNRYLNDIVPFEEIRIRSNSPKIYLTKVGAGELNEGSELLLKKGSTIGIGFLNKREFLRRRIEIVHRFRK